MADSPREEIAKLEALYASNPKGRVFTHLAEAYRREGELERAQEIIEGGLRHHPDHASAHVVLGRIHEALGRQTEAAAAFQRVLELDGENRVALRSLAELALSAGDPASAVGHYRTLVQANPGDEDARSLLAALERRIADSADAAAAESEPPPSPPTAAPTIAWDEPLAGEDVPIALDSAAGGADEPLGDLGDGLSIEATSFSMDWGALEDESGSDAEPGADGGLPGDLGVFAALPEPGASPAGDFRFELPGDPPAALAEGSDDVFAAAMQPVPASPAEPVLPPASETEVYTETLAELYRVQGFPERAAEVYRALLADRPGDERLMMKLREVEGPHEPEAVPDTSDLAEWEALAASLESRGMPDEAAAPAAATGQPAADDWLEGVESAWTGGDGVAGVADSPYAWSDEDGQDSAAGPSVAEQLAALLGWKPTRGPGGEPEEEMLLLEEIQAPQGASPGSDLMPWDEPSGVDPSAAAPPSSDTMMPWEEPSSSEPTPSPEAPEPDRGGDAEQGEDDDDLEMFRSWLQSLKK